MAQDAQLEETLWSAVRALEESLELRRRVADRMAIRGVPHVTAGLREDIGDLERRAEALREMLLNGHRRKSRRRVRRSASLKRAR